MSCGTGLHFFIAFINQRHFRRFTAWQYLNGISHRNAPALNLSLKSAERMIRPADTLYRHGKPCFCRILFYINGFQIIQQCLSRIPWHMHRTFCNVISFGCRYRDHLRSAVLKLCQQHFYILLDLLKFFLFKIDQIHFVYGKYKMLNSHQGTDSGMASGLCQHTLACIYKNNRQIGKGSSYCHISRIFFMSRCVSHNKRTALCRKITVSNINGNSLLPLRHQPVQQKTVIYFTTSGSHFGIQLKRAFLIRKKQFCIIEHMSDQCRFSIIHTSTCDKF